MQQIFCNPEVNYAIDIDFRRASTTYSFSLAFIIAHSLLLFGTSYQFFKSIRVDNP